MMRGAFNAHHRNQLLVSIIIVSKRFAKHIAIIQQEFYWDKQKKLATEVSEILSFLKSLSVLCGKVLMIIETS